MMHIWLRRAAFAAAGVSCGFTAYFGYITAGDDAFARYFNAAGGALISLAVPIFFLLVSYAEHRGARVPLNIFLTCGILFGLMDAGSNTGALFAMREGSRLQATHANNTAQDVRQRLQRLETREATLLEKTANVKAWRDTRSIEANIADLVAKQEREAGRGGCGSRCEAINDQLRQEREELAVSKAIEAANAELAAVRKQISAIRAEVKETPGKVSPIDVITSKIGNIAAWDLSPDKSVQEFVYLLITLVLGCGLTILSGGLGYGASWLQGPQPMPDIPPHHGGSLRPVAQIPAAPQYQPAALQAHHYPEPAPAPRTMNTSIRVEGGQAQEVIEMMQRLRADLANSRA